MIGTQIKEFSIRFYYKAPQLPYAVTDVELFTEGGKNYAKVMIVQKGRGQFIV